MAQRVLSIYIVICLSDSNLKFLRHHSLLPIKTGNTKLIRPWSPAALSVSAIKQANTLRGKFRHHAIIFSEGKVSHWYCDGYDGYYQQCYYVSDWVRANPISVLVQLLDFFFEAELIHVLLDWSYYLNIMIYILFIINYTQKHYIHINQQQNQILTYIGADKNMQPPTPQALDGELHYLLPKIQNHPALSELSKHLRIRINSWLSKLQSIISNNIWRKNRNTYLRLLYIMLECREIMEPFSSMVPEELPTFHKHQINCILLKLTTKIKERQRDRDKQNRQLKLPNKINPSYIWSTLQQQYKNMSIGQSDPPKPPTRVSQPYNSTKPQQKRPHLNSNSININTNNLEPFSQGMDVLSPISQGMHVRANSNLSECTYNSLEKFRDMLTPKGGQTDATTGFKRKNCENTENPINILQQYQTNIINNTSQTKNNLPQQSVKYFKKNRQKSYEQMSYAYTQLQQPHRYSYNLQKISAIKHSQHSNSTYGDIGNTQSNDGNKEFYSKVFKFLDKYRPVLQEDTLYMQVMDELKTFIQSQHSHENQPQTYSLPQKQKASYKWTNKITSLKKSQTSQPKSKLVNFARYKDHTDCRQDEYQNQPQQQQHEQEDQEDRQSEIGNQNYNQTYVNGNCQDRLICENSYDYVSGKYSEYSSIQMDQGLSDSRMHNMQGNNINHMPLQLQKNTINMRTSRNPTTNPDMITSINQKHSQHQELNNNQHSSMFNKNGCQALCYKIAGIDLQPSHSLTNNETTVNVQYTKVYESVNVHGGMAGGSTNYNTRAHASLNQNYSGKENNIHHLKQKLKNF